VDTARFPRGVEVLARSLTVDGHTILRDRLSTDNLIDEGLELVYQNTPSSKLMLEEDPLAKQLSR
jgi:hypothetical protein